MSILLAGGAGYIGSHTAVELIRAGYEVVIADNYDNSCPEVINRIERITGTRPVVYEADVKSAEAMRQIFTENAIDVVIHFAGLKAVGESVQMPVKYYRNNIDTTLTLLEVMEEFDCKNIVFSSSATVYGEDAPVLYIESMGRGKCTNPYGWTKNMMEQILEDAAHADSEISVVLLRYFNPIGADESGLIGEDPQGIPNNLMPYVSQVAVGRRDKLTIFGNDYPTPDGTCRRDFSAAIHCGAKIVFVDSQPNSTELDYDKVAEAITDKTKAVVAVDLGGIICDYDRLYTAVESKRNLFKVKDGDDLGARIQQAKGRVLVFADCAHALGASKEGKMAGEWADFSSFSFHAVKNLTTAEGGAATWKDIPGIDNEEIYKQFQLYSLHGQSKDALAKTQVGVWDYDVVGPWYKCNMTDIMSALGLRQLDRYPELLEQRKKIIAVYDALCDELGVMHLNHYGDNHSSSGHLYLSRIPEINEAQRNDIIMKLAERGVASISIRDCI